jgi:predicted unusual protein kinase regulating ubiquinone biosynthesis (AarF/ABC1/UbiB family)
VIIRLVEVNPAIRFIRWVLFDDADPLIPHIVLLDAGLAASFSENISSQVHNFFKAIADRDHEGIARTILKLNAEGQPITTDPEVFVKEVSAKFKIQIEEFETGDGTMRSADNIKSIMQSVYMQYPFLLYNFFFTPWHTL